MRRAHAVVATAMLFVAGTAGSSSALTTQVIPGCEPAEGYQPGQLCTVEVEPLEPGCLDTVPQLPYAVTVLGPDDAPLPVDTIDITWVNPDGDDVVLVDQPLEGTLVWPGTVVGGDGRATDWPGWSRAADGTWSQGDEFSWATGSVEVMFGSTPAVATTVAYPDGAECRPAGVVPVNNPGTTTPGGTPGTSTPGTSTPGTTGGSTGLPAVLAQTGAAGPALAIGAGALLVGGTSLVLLRRARRDGI